MFYGVDLSSRLLLGTARYPSPKVLADAIQASGAEVVTVSLRREGGPESSGGRAGQSFWSIIRLALTALGYGGKKVATAVNGRFVPAPARAATALNDGDKLEVVAPMQGG